MPVLIVGADTPVGAAVVAHLGDRDGEIRVFVTDPMVGDSMRSEGLKVAVGDVSDASHIEGAARGAFAAVLVIAAAHDGRTTSFAAPADVPAQWVDAVAAAGVQRVILVGDAVVARPGRVPEWAIVPIGDRSLAQIAEVVAALDDAERI